MQAVFIISLFTMVLAIMASIMSGTTSSSAELSKSYVNETRRYFTNIDKIVNSDVTMQYLHGNPKNAATPAEYIRGMPQVRQLSTAFYADPAMDAWGQVIQGRILTVYETLSGSSSDPSHNVLVPVTAFLLVSGGPDRVIQTTIPAVTNLNMLYGVSVPLSGTVPLNDDIIYQFDNRKAQQQLFEAMRLRLERIATAALKEVQGELTIYRKQKLDNYQTLLAQGKDVSLSLIDISTDANAPKFKPMNETETGRANRRELGVDAEFDAIEQTLAGGGRMSLSTNTPATPAESMVMTVTNDAANPTPWGPGNKFKYVMSVNAISSTIK